MRLAGHDISAF